jgi:hypothetical protein
MSVSQTLVPANLPGISLKCGFLPSKLGLGLRAHISNKLLDATRSAVPHTTLRSQDLDPHSREDVWGITLPSARPGVFSLKQ